MTASTENAWRFSELRVQVFIERFFNTDEWRHHRPMSTDDSQSFRTLVYNLKDSDWLRGITHDIWWHDQAAFDCAKAAFRYAAIKQYPGMPSIDKLERLSHGIRDLFHMGMKPPYTDFPIIKQDEMVLSAVLKGIPLSALIDRFYTHMNEQHIPFQDQENDKLLSAIVSKMLPDSEQFARRILAVSSAQNGTDQDVLYCADTSDLCAILREGIALYGANVLTAMQALIQDINLRRSMDFSAKPKTHKWVTSLLNTYCVSSFDTKTTE